MTTSTKRVLGCASIIVVALTVSLIAWLMTYREPPPLQLALADGRILQIEAVTYGTNHQVGRKSLVLKRFGPWLPPFVREWLTPKWPHAEIHRDKPALVVWVNTLDAVGGTNVDCQGIRVEFVDDHGDLFGTETSHWFGGNKFWHQGHVFDAYPRTQTRLRLNVTPWNTNVTSSIEIHNPKVHHVAQWTSRQLPQTNSVAGMQIVLKELAVRTNGGPKKRWKTPARFWEPAFEFRHGGTQVTGWDAPQWTASDPTGNYGQFLGVHQSVLKYSATFYPSATNVETATLIASLPKVPFGGSASNVIWNARFPLERTNLLAYGILPPGRNIFAEGLLVTNFPGPLPQGARGWSSQGKWINPLKMEETVTHRAHLPTLYIQFPKTTADTRFGVRLRDDQNRYWLAQPDGSSSRDDIRAYLIELPPEVTTITPEVVQLNPITTEFTVSTPAAK